MTKAINTWSWVEDTLLLYQNNCYSESPQQSLLRSYTLKYNYTCILLLCYMKLEYDGCVVGFCIATVEAQQVLVTNGSFQSEPCISPRLSSPAPYFNYTLESDVTFNEAEVNRYYSVNVNRSFGPRGHHQAVVYISDVNSELNNSLITCWVESTVILQYRLIIQLPEIDVTVTTEMDESLIRTSNGIRFKQS